MNKEVKKILFSFMTQYDSNRWIDLLESVQDDINNRKSSATGFNANYIWNESNSSDKNLVYKRIKANAVKMLKKSTKKVSFKEFFVGDHVRISLNSDPSVRKYTFRKSYKPNWSKNIFIINKINKGDDTVLDSFYLKNKITKKVLNRAFLLINCKK